jgi:hypothetical protein
MAQHLRERRLLWKFIRNLNLPFGGAVGGAAALAILGFTWGGWVTGGTAEATAKRRASMAVVSALAPMRIDNFRHQANASASLAELKSINAAGRVR